MAAMLNKPPNITIDKNLSDLEGLSPDQVEAILAELQLPIGDHNRVVELVTAMQTEMTGGQSIAVLGGILDRMRALSRAAYEQIGKPLFIQFLQRRRDMVGDQAP